MDRISTATKAVDLFGAGKHGFKNSNVGAGIAATDLNAEWFNDVQEELLAIISAAGIVPTAGIRNQLLAALRADGVFQTAAQFDVTAKAATMAAVQRALGSFSDALILGSNVALTNLDAGKAISFNAGATGCLLPVGSTLVKGVCFAFLSTVNGVALGVQGGNTINLGTTSVAGLTLNAGDTLILQWNGSSYACIGGSAQLAYASVFAASLAGAGYQKLPGGFILQWGSNATSASADTAVSFPIAFPNACRLVIPAEQNSSANGAWAALNTPSVSGFNLSGWSSVSSRVAFVAGWIAIGF